MKKKNNRSFISETYKNKTFLVFYCSDNTKKRLSLGPFEDENKAHFEMNQYLLQGICSWIVSYNG
tara:strand:+ start:67 stop:261 length:195 start_codon:yes stop_codon:yes gene_type:complete